MIKDLKKNYNVTLTQPSLLLTFFCMNPFSMETASCKIEILEQTNKQIDGRTDGRTSCEPYLA